MAESRKGRETPPPFVQLHDLLKHAVKSGASDLHLKVGNYPMMRQHGSLVRASNDRQLQPADTAAIASVILSASYQRRFEETLDVDFAYSLPGLGRFRCNIFQQRGSVGLVLRIIQMQIRSFEELRLPAVIRRIADEQRGLVLVTGTTTSGKSTTLASMIEHINKTRCAHVITIEDPIEYLHRDDKSIINQREVDVDTRSFASALRSALRQDPDVVMLGEMRDLETIETALLAAETGHLVYSTLHTLDATETINRIISAFPVHQQRQVRSQLANVLKAVISLRLMERADGQGRVPAVEVMTTTAFIRNCIADPDKTHLIPGAIAAGAHPYGMQTFDQSIYGLVQAGLVGQDIALRQASNADEFRMKVQGIERTSDNARELQGEAEPTEAGGIVHFSR